MSKKLKRPQYAERTNLTSANSLLASNSSSGRLKVAFQSKQAELRRRLLMNAERKKLAQCVQNKKIEKQTQEVGLPNIQIQTCPKSLKHPKSFTNLLSTTLSESQITTFSSQNSSTILSAARSRVTKKSKKMITKKSSTTYKNKSVEKTSAPLLSAKLLRSSSSRLVVKPSNQKISLHKLESKNVPANKTHSECLTSESTVQSDRQNDSESAQVWPPYTKTLKEGLAVQLKSIITSQQEAQQKTLATPKQEGLAGQLKPLIIAPPEGFDPYYYYNIAFMDNATPFWDIVGHKIGDLETKVFPYLIKFDRATRSAANLYTYPRQLVNVKRKVPSREASTDLEWTCLENSKSEQNQENHAYMRIKSLRIQPFFVKQDINSRYRQVVVINFEGVIGDYQKKNLIDESSPCLYIRPGAIEGLKLLWQSFQLILVCGYRSVRFLRILSYLKTKGVMLMGAYQIRQANMKDTQDVWDKDLLSFLDYSKIYSDLALKPPFSTKVIVLSPMNLENSDISERTGNDLLYEKIGLKQIMFVEKIPVSTDMNFELPLCFCVPNARAQIAGEVLSMLQIAQALLELAQKKAHGQSWVENHKYWKLKNSVAFHPTESTMQHARFAYSSEIHSIYLSKIRETSFTSEQKQAGCLRAIAKTKAVLYAQNKRANKDEQGKVVMKNSWPMHQVSFPESTVSNSVGHENHFLILPADPWLGTDSVGKYETVLFENMTLETGYLNLLHYKDK